VVLLGVLIAASPLVACVIALVVWAFRNHRAKPDSRPYNTVPRPRAATTIDKEMNETERIEKELTARLLAGELDRACYRKEMEALTTREPQSNKDLQ
jgi:hypothetical protein